MDIETEKVTDLSTLSELEDTNLFPIHNGSGLKAATLSTIKTALASVTVKETEAMQFIKENYIQRGSVAVSNFVGSTYRTAYISSSYNLKIYLKTATVTFDTPYTHVPRVILTPYVSVDPNTNVTPVAFAMVGDLTTTGFTIQEWLFTTDGNTPSPTTCYWMATGTIVEDDTEDDA